MSIQENEGAVRPTNPYISPLTAELSRELQEKDFTRPSGYSIEFAQMIARQIAEYDGHLTESEMESVQWWR